MDLQIFSGNIDQFTTVTHSLDGVKNAQFVRLEVKSWHQDICMRVELFGCDGKLQLLLSFLYVPIFAPSTIMVMRV